MERLPVSLPTTILAPLTTHVQEERDEQDAAHAAAGDVDVDGGGRGRHRYFILRALLLGGEDPAHDLAGLDLLLRAPELAVAQEPGGGVAGGDGVHLRPDAAEALLPALHVGHAQVHPARAGPGLDALGGDLEGLVVARAGRDLALRPAQQAAVGQEDRDADGEDVAAEGGVRRSRGSAARRAISAGSLSRTRSMEP